MNWAKVKKTISINISLFLREQGFVQSKNSLEWVRYVNNVCQILRCEKMSGNHIRLYTFILTPDFKSIGGHLERYIVQGSINYPGQYYWSIIDSELQVSLTNINLTIKEVAIPWFSTIVSEEIVHQVICNYKVQNLYTIDKNYFSSNEDITNIDREFKYWKKLEIEELFKEYLLPKLSSHGFVETCCDFTYIRKRNEVYDLIEILPINFGVHLACFAYNWIDDFSDEDSKGFSDDARVMFNGGQVDINGLFKGAPKIYEINDLNMLLSKINIIYNILRNTTIPKLEVVKSKKDFISSVDKMHEYSLKAYGLI